MATKAPTTKKPAAKKAPAKKVTKPTSDQFAIIATGGKQYGVSVGDTITIEKLPGEFKKGDAITFDQVLLSEKAGAVTIGTPTIASAKVTSEVVSVGRLAKVTVLRYKQKSRYMKKNGHKQPFIKVKITAIS